MTKIKICGLFRPEDIECVNEAEPDYVGFILNFPRSHRNLSVDAARRLRERLHPSILAVGVFVDQPCRVVAEAAEEIGLDVIQLHGHEDNTYILSLRDLVRSEIWKAFRVRSVQDLEQAGNCPADKILLDSGYGGGEMFDWTLAGDFGRPFILAGGLTPESIPEAVRRLAPEAIDISSGVETDRLKDPVKIRAAVQAAHAQIALK